MTRRLPLSALAALIQDTIESVFYDESFWVIAEITDVKRYEQKRWCFLKFMEKHRDQVLAEMQGIFWSNTYNEIAAFESKTGQRFESGIEISCRVMVRFHPRYGLKLEVQEIDTSFTLGMMEMERQQTIDRLLKTFPSQIKFADGEFFTPNKQLPFPKVLQRVALIAATGSDGERDFRHELLHNQYGYQFFLTLFPASVQGQSAVPELLQQLNIIHQQAADFDVVAMVRGGGSNTDFAAFDHYEIASRVAFFPIPVFTGIGHDRNTSIADLMAWQFKTPTKTAAAIVDTALRFETDLLQLKENINERWEAIVADRKTALHQWQQHMQLVVPHRLHRKKERLHDWRILVQKTARDEMKHYKSELAEKDKRLATNSMRIFQYRKMQLFQVKKLVENLSPEKILNRGFALVKQQEILVTNASQLDTALPMVTLLRNKKISSSITEISNNEG